jgi:hypothetical protein
MSYKTKGAALVACMLAIGVALTPQSVSAQLCTDKPPPQQTALMRPIPLGISGGNIRSLIMKNGKVRGCFSGTLGSMVQDSNSQYILSNNHVIADQNMAKPGQFILQPGLVDVECIKSTSNKVATFSRAVKINFLSGKNTVDAAIAAVEPGQVSPDILFIGGIAGTVVSTPTLGLAVTKMGRTTCLTQGVIAALNANVNVNYSDNPRKKKLAKFFGQILVTGDIVTPIFGGAGDSGSLIVTDDDINCPQAVGLLFAGTGTGLTIANPITAVMSGLGVSMVGDCTGLASDPPQADVAAPDVGVAADVVKSATAVRDHHEDSLMRIAGAVGTGITAGDQPGQAEIAVYVDKLTPQAQAVAPKEIEGLHVKLIESGEFDAF